MTPDERAAWERLFAAEAELVAACREVMRATKRGAVDRALSQPVDERLRRRWGA